MLKKRTPQHGFYEDNVELIHTYFFTGAFDMNLTRVLHASIEQLHAIRRRRDRDD